MERPSNRSYALRGNRLTRAQGLAMQTQWGNFSLQVEDQLLINDLFPDKKQVILEIGLSPAVRASWLSSSNSLSK